MKVLDLLKAQQLGMAQAVKIAAPGKKVTAERVGGISVNRIRKISPSKAI